MADTATTHTLARWRPRFFTIWTGQAFSLVGSTLAQFALVWWLTSTTGSATVLAIGTLAALLPEVILGPLVGTLVDRWNRRAVMIVADSAVAACAALLVYLYAIGGVQVWHIYLIMFARSVGGAFHWPAMQASTTLMVPEEHLSRIAGINQALRGAINIVAPPIGALLLAVMPLHGVLAVDVVTAALAVGTLFFVSIPEPERAPAAPGKQGTSLWQEMAAGFRYLWAWPGLLAVVLMATLVNLLLKPAFALVPILVTKHFGGAALELAWIDSAAGAGIVAGGLLLGVWGGFHRRILTSLTGMIGLGAAMLLLGIAPANAFWLALAAVVLVGGTISLIDGPLMAVLQASVAPDMQGRVFSLVGSLAAAMSPLGLAVAGPVADAIGVQAWIVASAVACMLSGLIGFLIPAISQLGERQLALAAAPVPDATGECG